MPFAYTCELQVDSVVRNFLPGSLSLENIGLGRQILRFVLIHETGGVAFTRAAKKDRVLLLVDGQAVFDGIVWTVGETRIAENVGIRQTVECTDYGKLSEKVPINEPHPAGTLQAALNHIVVNMAAHGISAATMPDPGPTLPDMLWVWLTLRQVIEMVSTTSGWMPQWAGTQLTFVEPGSTPAPFTIDDTDPNWLSLSTGSTLETKWNGVWGRYGPRGQIIRTETLPGDGSTIAWTLESPLIMIGNQVTPSGLVTVHRSGGDSQETTDAVGFPGYGPAQWHYDPATNTITQNTGASAILGSGESVDVQYTGDSPGAVFALDEADYVENGPFITIIDNPNIELKSQATSWIEGKLQELIGDEEKVTLVTDRFGLEPFQALLIDVEDFLVNGDHLILKTQMQHVARVTKELAIDGVGYHRFTWSVEAVLGNAYRANWERFFRPNAGNPGTGGAVLYTQPPVGGCSASSGLILFSDNWDTAAEPWTNWPDNDEGAGVAAAAEDLELVGGQIRLVGTGFSSSNRIGRTFDVQFFEGCVEFSYMAASGLSTSSTSELVELGSPTPADIYFGPFITIAHIHNGALDEAIAVYYETNFGNIVAFTSAAGVISTSQMDVYRLEFKLSYSSVGYLRLYKNGVQLVNDTGVDWPGTLAANGVFRAVRVTPKGTLDNFVLRVLDATAIPSASASPSSSASRSASPSSSVSASPSPSAGNSPSLSPSASVSPTPSPSVSPSSSASASVSPSSSVSRSPSASVSPSASTSPSSSVSRSPSASPSPTPSASVSPSAGAGFPAVLAVAKGASQSGNVTTHPIVIPPHNVGDLITVFFSVDENPTVSVNAGASSSGWTLATQLGSASAVTGVMASKIATGTETLTLTTSNAQMSTHETVVSDGSAVDATSIGSTSQDPPNHTPAGGTQNYLWIVFVASDDAFPVTSAPTNFDELRSTAAVSGSAATSIMEREFNGSSLNPSTFGGTLVNRAIFTVAIAP